MTPGQIALVVVAAGVKRPFMVTSVNSEANTISGQIFVDPSDNPASWAAVPRANLPYDSTGTQVGSWSNPS